jgi:Tfp pilus assembly protein PilV
MRRAIRLRDEQGIALTMAVLIMTVLVISVVAVISYSTSNYSSSNRARVDEATLFAAEAGLDEALSRLNEAIDPHVSTLLLPTTTTIEGSTVNYSGTFDGVTNQWTVTSSATTPSPVGGTAPLVRTITQGLQVSPAPGTVAENPAWGYLYADSPLGCTTLNSGVRIKQPVYVKNDLCLANNVKIHASAGTVQVGGPNGITMNGSAVIGVAPDDTTIQPLPTLKVARPGCRSGSNPYSWPCSGAAPPAGQRVNATNQYPSIDAISKPPIDLAARYADASPGPLDFCDNASPGIPTNFFETNAVVNDRSAGDRNIMPNFDYTCTTTAGTLAWDYQASGPGTLTIDGTIFIDGNILISPSTRGVYQGKGTIYVSGTITLNSSVQICGKWDAATSTCDWSTWDPEQNLLFLVAGHPTAAPAISLTATNRFQGGLWAETRIDVNATAIAQGPQIANELFYASSTGSLMIPFENLPPGAPAIPSWQALPIPGTWREV